MSDELHGWKMSAPVPFVPRPERAPRTAPASPDLDRLRSALAAIPNAGDDELSYEKWWAVVAAIHDATEGSDEGLELAHDFSSRASVYDADFLDNRVWPYLRSDRDEVLGAQYVYAMASRHGWRDPTVIEAFDVIEAAPAEKARRARFAPIPVAEFATGKPQGWIVKGVLPAASLAVIYGESGSGKSFFAWDIAFAVARGVPWRGRKVRQGAVVLIVAEGAGGARMRAVAYARQHEIALADVALHVIAAAPRFTDADDIRELVEQVRALRPVLIVVDTLSRVLAGADENSNEDMGRVVTHCGTLHEATGAMVGLVHHSGKDAARGARGWSGLRAAADVELEVTRDGETRVATVTKQKDGEDGGRFGFRLAVVPVGHDEDGDVISSCIVEEADAGARGAGPGSLGPTPRLVLGVVREHVGLDGKGVSLAVVTEAAVAQLPHDEGAGKRDRRRELVIRALERLQERCLIEVRDGRYHIVGEV